MAKLVVQIERADRIQEIVNRAFQVASSGRPGPVVISLPEDMLVDKAVPATIRAYAPARIAPGLGLVEATLGLLETARRPLIVLGGSTWDAAATRGIRTFAEANAIPLATTFHRQDLVDNNSSAYVGCIGVETNPELLALAEEADVLLVAGSRLNEIVSRNFSLLAIPVPRQKLIHVLPDAEGIGRLHQPIIGIAADLRLFIDAIAAKRLKVPPDWHSRLKAARTSYLRWIEPVENPGTLNLSEVVLAVERHAGADAIICNGAGNYDVWVHRFTRFRSFRSQMGSTSGSMGYGIPAAVAAKLTHPNRSVVAYVGDGCLMMTVQELATAAEHGLNILVLVANNGMFGTIRMHQEREFPGRPVATLIMNPDFTALGTAFGFRAERIERTEQIEGALERWSASGRATLLELIVDPDASTPRLRLSDLPKSS